MMKYIIFPFLLVCCLVAAGQQTLVSGKFISAQREFKVEDISAFQYLQPQGGEFDVKADEHGTFRVLLPLRKPGYYRIGRNILYLSPGDQLKVSIDHKDPQKSSFEGRGSVANNYLRATPFPKGGSYLEAGKLIQSDPQETLKQILAVAQSRRKGLNGLKGISGTFRKLEEARIKADVLNSIRSVPYYAARKLKLVPGAAQEYLSAFQSLSSAVRLQYSGELSDPNLLQLVVYRDLATELSRIHQKVSRLSDWLLADSLVKQMQALSDRQQILACSSSLKKIQYLDFRQAAFRTQESLLRYGNGDVAVDFQAVDLQGKTVRLSDLKGKIIFIDLWAVWCGPCLAEMPAFELLKAKYANDDRVVFLSLSIDHDLEAWRKNVSERNAGGLQWRVSRTALNDYKVLNIPRTLLIDQEFKIVDFQAAVPSSPVHQAMLDKLLSGMPAAGQFRLHGKLDQAKSGAVMYLSYTSITGQTVRDSARLEAGYFKFEGVVGEPMRAELLLSPEGGYVVKKNSDRTSVYLGLGEVWLEGRDSIANSLIRGDVENAANQTLKASLLPLQRGQLALLYALNAGDRGDDSFVAVLKQKNASLIAQQQSLRKAFILSHPDLMLSLDVIKDYFGPVMEASMATTMFNNLSDRVKSSVAGKRLATSLEELNQTAVGRLAPDFGGGSPDGKEIRLGDFRGQYVLIDFWASWCAPCRAENPNLLKAYGQYHSRNFNILGVSLDDERGEQAWIKAIRDDGLTWPQVSELKGFEAEAAKLYQIKAIPQNVLIDPSGKIVAKNVKGKILFDTLRGLLGE